MSFKKDFLRLVGIIIKPHGLQGELLVKPLTDYPKSFFPGQTIYLDESQREKRILETIRFIKIKGKDGLLMKFEGIDDVDQARLLSQREIYRTASSSPALEQDEFWVDEIIGCDVYGPDAKKLGKVEDVHSSLSNDNLVVDCGQETGPKGPRDLQMMVPMIEDYILEIDVMGKKIRLKRVPEYD